MGDPSSADAERDRLDFIQALRGIAAFMIVVYHLKWYLNGPEWLKLGDRVLGNAHIGVDLFFVISGFIMVHASRSSDGSLRYVAAFMVKRFARIWPVYVVVTVVFLFAMRRLDTIDPVILAKGLAFLPIQAHPAPFFGEPALHVGWTLVYEMYFYLLFAVALLGRRWRWALLATLAGLTLIVLPVAMAGHATLDAKQSFRFTPAILNIITSPMVWEFLAGVAIGLLYRSRFRIPWRPLRLALVWLSITVVLWQYGTGYHAGHGPMASGIGLAVMVLMLALHDKEERLRVPQWLVWLGNVSFSLYLVHRIPQLALPPILKDLGLPELVERGGGIVITNIVLALLLAYLSHRYLEVRLSEWLRNFMLRRLRLETPRP
jgi:exopolysaccharide production protein ExoZ